MKEADFENMCVSVKNKPPRVVFARSATTEDVFDAIAGELLLAVRKSVGAHATRSINPPAKGQTHSEARIAEIVRVVTRHSGDFDPCVQINKLINDILARRAKLKQHL